MTSASVASLPLIRFESCFSRRFSSSSASSSGRERGLEDLLDPGRLLGRQPELGLHLLVLPPLEALPAGLPGASRRGCARPPAWRSLAAAQLRHREYGVATVMTDSWVTPSPAPRITTTGDRPFTRGDRSAWPADASRSITCPTMLSGVEAPAVRPTATGPCRRQPARVTISAGPPDRPVPDLAPARPGSRRPRCGRSAAGRRRSAPGCRCCCCCSRRSPPSGRAGAAPSSATTASWRSCVALQIVSNARKRSASAPSPYRSRHRGPEHLADLQRLRHQHRRLVGQADAFEVAVGVEPGRRRVAESRQECGRVAAAADVTRTHASASSAVQHDQVPAARKPERLRRRRAGLLVVDLPVDDRGEAVLRVPPDVLPDVQHRPARGVDERAARRLEAARARPPSRRTPAG